MRKKKTVALLSAITVLGASATALAATSYLESGIWKHGTTGMFGGGEVYSEYVDWDHNWYTATVINAKGKKVKDTETNGYTYATARTTAYSFKTDYTYYNYGN